MKLTNLSLICFGCLALNFLACSSKKLKSAQSSVPEIVYATTGSKSIPDWVYQKPVFEKDDRIFVAGVIDLNGNQNPSQGLAAADLQARAEIVKMIESRMSLQLQLANEGFGYSEQVLHQIVNMAAGVEALQNIRIEQRGYAQIQSQVGGETINRYTCFSQASVARADLDQMIQRSLENSEKRGDISELFREKVEKSWREFFNSKNLDALEAQ